MEKRKKEQLFLILVAILLSLGHSYVELNIIGPTLLGVLILPLFIGLRIIYFCTASIYRDAISLVIWLYLELSFIVWPGINALGSGLNYPKEQVVFAYKLGLILLLIHALIALLFSHKKYKKIDYNVWQDLPTKSVKYIWIFFVIFTFFMSVVSYKLGLTELGEEKPTLPFQLNGFFVYYRQIAATFLFIVFIDIFYTKQYQKLTLQAISFYFIWHILEMLIRLSKGQLMLALIPFLLWCMYKGLFKVRYFKFLFIILFIFSIFYPIFKTYRLYDMNSFYSAVTKTYRMLSAQDQFTINVIQGFYERIFRAGKDIAEFKPFLDYPYISGKLKAVVKYGGTPKYHTRVVDDIPEDIIHSSGCTGLSDAFLIGGIPNTIFTMLLISLFSTFIIDRNRLDNIFGSTAGRTLLAYFLFTLVMGRTWSIIFKGLLFNLVWPTCFLIHYFLLKYARYQQIKVKKLR